MAINDFFSVLGEADQRVLRSLMSRRRFERNEVVFHQGDPAASMHVIESGWFLVQVVTRAGDRVGMTIEGPGDVFGELALLDTIGRRTATIRALRPSETMSLDADNFDELRRSKPEIDRFLVVLLTSRVERLTTQLAEAAWTPADKRVCRQVCRLLEVFEGGTILLKQTELASLAQTTRPTVSTVLSDLAKDEILITGRGFLKVLDPVALRVRAGY
jgi:CRP/FNR family transcriptional regulator, cyclic AMP receptor protein